jgi:Leucine-rich repeat (LRR) protein
MDLVLKLSNGELSQNEIDEIKRLSIGYEIAKIPECICKLNNLQVLHLGFNKISSIPEYLVNFTNLSHLNLYSKSNINNSRIFGKINKFEIYFIRF